MSHKITCVITGKTITVSNEYFDKKISEYGSEELFNSLYTSRQAKSLLKRGYKVKEIRDLLKVEDSFPEISDKIVKQILSIKDEESTTYENSSIKKSDLDVIEYISSIR